ncbi:MFS transporter [Legionella israelensis]|uniref:MFS transporter n=1 Tax=Legionella israelensis TaxID=454 RepID=UPI00163D8C71|nr:MFS transporter [Legionella israelensis]
MKKNNIFFNHFAFLFAIFVDGITISIVFPILDILLINERTTILSHQSTVYFREIVYSFVIFIYTVSWAWGNAFMSALSDKIGRKPTLLFAMMGRMVGFILTILCIVLSSLSLLILGRIIEGLTNGVQPEAEAVGCDLSPTRQLKPTYIGYMLLPVAIGDLVGGTLTEYVNQFSWLGEDISARSLYFGLLMSGIAFILVAFFSKETFAPSSRSRPIGFFYPVQIFIEAIREKIVLILGAIFIISVIGWGCFYNYLATFAAGQYHFSESQTGLLMTTMSIGFFLGWGFLVRFFHTLWKSMDVFILTETGGAIVILLIILIPNSWLLWFFVPLAALFIVIGYTAMLGLFANAVSSKKQGWVMGIAGAIHFLAFALSGLVATLFIRISITAIFYAAVVLISLSVGMMIFFKRLYNPS